MADFYQQKVLNSGSFLGTTLIQAHGEIGGHRYVFVKWQGSSKNSLVFPTTGGILKNPFKGNAKIFAGDLVEFNPGLDDKGATVKILKTYEVAKDVAEADTTVLIVRNGYRHIPFVGDNIMVAPDTLDGTGTAVTVTAVEKTADSGVDVWKLTISAALGTVKKGTVLIEAAETGADKKPMVTNPNAYAPSDYDCLYDPASGDDDFEGARYMFTPCIANEDTKLYTNRMSPLPQAVKALNKSRVDGWFNL